MMQKIGQLIFLTLWSSCSTPKYWAIQHDDAVLVNNKDSETIACSSTKAKKFICLSIEDLLKLKRKCF